MSHRVVRRWYPRGLVDTTVAIDASPAWSAIVSLPTTSMRAARVVKAQPQTYQTDSQTGWFTAVLEAVSRVAERWAASVRRRQRSARR